jgi:hypothetical protein
MIERNNKATASATILDVISINISDYQNPFSSSHIFITPSTKVQSLRSIMPATTMSIVRSANTIVRRDNDPQSAAITGTGMALLISWPFIMVAGIAIVVIVVEMSCGNGGCIRTFIMWTRDSVIGRLIHRRRSGHRAASEPQLPAYELQKIQRPERAYHQPGSGLSSGRSSIIGRA